MAVYKVIQDIESEDKLLGPLTLKGFVYAAIAGISAYIEVRLLLAGTPIKFLFMLLFAFPMVLFGLLASPLGREQPTEVWLLSRIRYFLKPRERIWDQEGVSEQVTITAPKKEELRLTKDLSQTEVQSRLKTLAQTLDTRGWAIKNVDVNLNTPENGSTIATPVSDRLIGSAGVPQQMPVVDVHAADDILDEKNNPTAQKFDSLMKKADAVRKNGLLTRLKGIVDLDELPKARKKPGPADGTKDLPATKAAMARVKKTRQKELAQQKQVAKDELQASLNEAADKFAQEDRSGKNPKHQILSESPTVPAKPQPPKSTPEPPAVTAARQTVNMELAQSGNAFSVATLSRLANRPPEIEQTGPNEVTISLH
jgi:hypothetical protein